MIISASRRTDIPAYYSDWFLSRLREGYLYVPNPMNRKQVSKVLLAPEFIECIVFWTKNPLPILIALDEIDSLGYKYYFQFTLTSYDKSVEPDVPPKGEIIDTFRRLSQRIGSEKVIWRYDPIFIAKKFSIDYHVKWFEYLAKELSGYTHKCIISFINMYKKCERNMAGLGIEALSQSQKRAFAELLSKIAAESGIALETCAESIDPADSGINPGRCIDDRLISKITGWSLETTKDSNQRAECRCITSVDIGSYNTCKHNCLYCYANLNKDLVRDNFNYHDKDSALLTGKLRGDEKITERKMTVFKCHQLKLF
jgi:hypothetical protein